MRAIPGPSIVMEAEALQTIDIPRILALAPMVDEYALGTDFILGKVSGKEVEKSQALLSMLKYPIRFEGYIFFFVHNGRFKVDLNLDTYEVRENTLLLTVPGNIIKLSSFNEERIGDTEMHFIFASRSFMSSVHFDINSVFQESLRLWNNPCIPLTGEDLSLAEKYFTLARTILESPRQNKREIIASLLTSFIYSAVDLWTRQLAQSREPGTRSSARINQLFERFITLVTEYHNTQRGMAFYAEKLCLTPKYLSKLVKQASGRGAPEWIDSFVILEAKNLLKYSEKSVKEIVYYLHFPNQSVFYKFFKSHTGMTPTEYRKG